MFWLQNPVFLVHIIDLRLLLMALLVLTALVSLRLKGFYAQVVPHMLTVYYSVLRIRAC